MNIQEISKPAKAPEFELLSVTGERVSLKQYRGKVVLLSFWTTW
jgi:peroxiredoxin